MLGTITIWRRAVLFNGALKTFYYGDIWLRTPRKWDRKPAADTSWDVVFIWQQGIFYMNCPIDRIIPTMAFSIPVVVETGKSPVLGLPLWFNPVIQQLRQVLYLLSNDIHSVVIFYSVLYFKLVCFIKKYFIWR